MRNNNLLLKVGFLVLPFASSILADEREFRANRIDRTCRSGRDCNGRYNVVCNEENVCAPTYCLHRACIYPGPCPGGRICAGNNCCADPMPEYAEVAALIPPTPQPPQSNSCYNCNYDSDCESDQICSSNCCTTRTSVVIASHSSRLKKHPEVIVAIAVFLVVLPFYD